mgnify:CR=1 FL=1
MVLPSNCQENSLLCHYVSAREQFTLTLYVRKTRYYATIWKKTSFVGICQNTSYLVLPMTVYTTDVVMTNVCLFESRNAQGRVFEFRHDESIQFSY